ncbi:hypothetical protein ACQ4PT_015086 [Festuca glaucescens]
MDSRITFLAEMFGCGEPDLRPEHGHCMLTRTLGMVKLEEKWHGRALVAMVEGRWPPVSPEDIVVVVVVHCGVNHHAVKVLVCASHSTSSCVSVHARTAPVSSMPPTSSLPKEAWEFHTVSQFISKLGGNRVKMLKSEDSWYVEVMSEIKTPSEVPKVYDVEVPEPGSPRSEFEDPYSTTKKRKVVHTILIHVEQVVDRGLIITELPLSYPDDDANKKHTRAQVPFLGRPWQWYWLSSVKVRWALLRRACWQGTVRKRR